MINSALTSGSSSGMCLIRGREMITNDQLDILKDMFSQNDDEWLLSHLSLKSTGHRNFVIEVDNGSSQDCEELFAGNDSDVQSKS